MYITADKFLLLSLLLILHFSNKGLRIRDIRKFQMLLIINIQGIKGAEA